MVGVVKLYDKRDDLIFPTVNFPFISQHFHIILQIVALLLFVSTFRAGTACPSGASELTPGF
jgi:hypothetical protein